MTTYHGGIRPPRDGEHVQVECWCQRSTVWVPIEQIRAGRTAACFRKDCRTWTGRN